MKWIFSFCLIFSCEVNARDIVVLSGNYKGKLPIIEKVLTSNLGVSKQFIGKEKDNRKCLRRSDAIIQLCFNGLDYKVVHVKINLLKNTLGRLLSLNTKGPQIRGPRNQK